MATKENLEAAFAGESQANRKYLAFAKKADADGLTQIAKLFRAAAEAETVHAHAHMRAMKAVKSTKENLEAAMVGEDFEFKQMYPKFIAEAQEDDNKAALISFQNAMAVEQVHYSLYLDAFKAVQEEKDLPVKSILICKVCGNTVLDEAPVKCPVCGAKKEQFIEIE